MGEIIDLNNFRKEKNKLKEENLPKSDKKIKSFNKTDKLSFTRFTGTNGLEIKAAYIVVKDDGSIPIYPDENFDPPPRAA